MLGYPGGVPTSLFESSQQWDFPNAWPPTTEILISALSRAKEEEGASDAEDLEMDVVRKWIKNYYVTWKSTEGIMFEKYDVRRVSDKLYQEL
jgi:alpha,alpha-trehalase